MTALEIAIMLNITESEAHDLIECCDRFDRGMQSLYDEEERDDRFDELIEAADWEFELDKGDGDR